MTKVNNLHLINNNMNEKNDKNIKISENQKNINLFDEYDKNVQKSRLKASLDNWVIDEKEYLNEVKWLPVEERSISDFIEEKKDESIALKKYMLENEEILSTIEFVTKLFEGKTSKLNWNPASDHLIGVAWILAKYNVSEQDIIVWLLHDVIEDIEDWEEKLREKWYSEEIISLVKELSEDKSLSWKERKTQYLEHLKEAANNIKIISAADKLYNTRSFLDDYLVEQDNMRNKFNAGKEDQVELLKKYLESLKNNFYHPITDELEEVIKRFLRMIK